MQTIRVLQWQIATHAAGAKPMKVKNELNPASEPAFSYSVVWASRDWGRSGQPVESLWQAAMADAKTITIEQLPDMTQW